MAGERVNSEDRATLAMTRSEKRPENVGDVRA